VLYIHERLVPAFEAVVANLEAEAANGNRYRIYSEPDTYTAETNTTRPGATTTAPSPDPEVLISRRGAAIDVNSLLNPYRATTSSSPTCPTGS